nr:nuclease-related domain-containing protein [Ramlibacter pallidus]
MREGVKGEKESAYFLDQYFKGGENHVLLHDLRISFEGDVAQIDHLIFNRGIGAYLIETKNYSGNVIINEHGEFTVDYGDERFGVPSPIEQSQRHARILKRLLERLEIKNRTGGPLECYHVVMSIQKRSSLGPGKQTLTPRTSSRRTSFLRGTSNSWRRSSA